MEIRKEEWTAFAEFIARESTHQCSCYPEDGTYVKCPYSTMERAYTAFIVYRCSHNSSVLLEKYHDVDVSLEGDDEMYEDSEDLCEDGYWDEVELCYEQQYPEWEWPDEADNYRANREKQIIRIAHELADRYPNLRVFGAHSWASLVFPFYDAYELDYKERDLFVCEYYTQRYLNEGSH